MLDLGNVIPYFIPSKQYADNRREKYPEQTHPKFPSGGWFPKGSNHCANLGYTYSVTEDVFGVKTNVQNQILKLNSASTKKEGGGGRGDDDDIRGKVSWGYCDHGHIGVMCNAIRVRSGGVGTMAQAAVHVDDEGNLSFAGMYNMYLSLHYTLETELTNLKFTYTVPKEIVVGIKRKMEAAKLINHVAPTMNFVCSDKNLKFVCEKGVGVSPRGGTVQMAVILTQVKKLNPATHYVQSLFGGDARIFQST